MRLLELELENFQRFVGTHKIKFQRGLSFITAENRDLIREEKGDNNGSGKTAILRSICWAIFGKTWDNKTGSALVSDYKESKGALRVKLSLSGGFVIERVYTSKGSRVSFTTPDNNYKCSTMEDNKGEDVSVVDEEIRKALKIDLKLFASGLYVSRTSTSVQFLYATPANRSKLLAGMIDDSVFQHAAKLLKTQRGHLENRYTKQKTEQELLLSKLEKEKKSLEALQASITRVQEKEEQRKEKIREQLAELKAEMEELSRVLLIPETDKMEDLERQRAEIKARILRNQDQLKECRLISEHNITPGTVCSLCLSKITESHTDYVLQHNEKTKERHKVLAQEQRLWTSELVEMEQRQERLRVIRAKKEKASPELANLKHRSAHLQMDLVQKSVDLSVLSDRMANCQATIQETQKRLTELEASVQDLASEIYVTKCLVTMLSVDMRNLMFDRIRGILEHLSARRIREAIGNGVVAKFPNTSAGGREQFTIEIWDKKKKRELSMWSEGESWRVAFAILLALREVMLARTGCKLSILLVDDPLGGLDKTGMKVFIDVLRGLSEVAETILVAVPRDELVEGDVCVHVIRENDLSKVVTHR